MLRALMKASEHAGEPMGVDISTALREATISLPTLDMLTAWCGYFSATGDPVVTANALGTVVATLGGVSERSWRIRLIWTDQS